MFPDETFHIHLYGPRSGNPASSQATTPIPSSFEAAEERLIRSLPMALIEPDGSFAWAGPDHQIVGMIYDAAAMIQYVEIRGRLNRGQLRDFVEILSGTTKIDDFATMVLPARQWKDFQSFANSLPESPSSAGSDSPI